jgi:hypothetical protein
VHRNASRRDGTAILFPRNVMFDDASVTMGNAICGKHVKVKPKFEMPRLISLLRLLICTSKNRNMFSSVCMYSRNAFIYM